MLIEKGKYDQVILTFTEEGLEITLNESLKRRYRRYQRGRRAARRHRYSRYNPDLLFSNIMFDSKEDAEKVLNALIMNMDDYNIVTMGDLYSLVGLSANYMHERYGWDRRVDLNSCTIEHTRDGYSINLPEPVYLDK